MVIKQDGRLSAAVSAAVEQQLDLVSAFCFIIHGRAEGLRFRQNFLTKVRPNCYQTCSDVRVT